MQVLPSKQLSYLVKHYLFVESKTKNVKKFRLFSDGHTGIVFSFKNRLISETSPHENKHFLPCSFVYGPINSFKTVSCFDETALLIVVFHPYSINNLLGIPAHELVDQILDLRDLFGPYGDEVTAKLYECTNLPDRIKIIESFLISIPKCNSHVVQPVVLATIDFIIAHQGLKTVDQLSDYTGYTRKSIDRKFMESIGIAPKKFSNIIKLNAYLKALRDRQDNNKLTDLAYQAGYYDYSHVFKEFKKNTGVTPLQYIGNFKPLALNLLELPKDE